MEQLKAKLKKQGGFTLMEMLIVVAIVAILIAISIPMFNAALERARQATDAANERAAKAALVLAYTTGKYEDANGVEQTFTEGDVFSYDASKGILSKAAVGKVNEGYGKSTSYEGADAVVRRGKILGGYITQAPTGGATTPPGGQVKMAWIAAGTAASTTNVNAGDALISPLLINS